MRILLQFFALLALCASFTFAADEELSRKAPPEIDQALRERVNQFYAFFQTGEFRKAEAFLDEESKDLFYGARKTRILGYEIKDLSYSDDFREAKALVACSTIVPMLGSRPLTMPVSSDWRFVDGSWVMHLEERENPLEKASDTPFGAMSFKQPTAPVPGAGVGPAPQANAPTLETLAKMFRISTDTLRFPKTGDDPVTRTVLFKNQAKGALTLERYTRDIPGIEVNVSRVEVEPDQELEIEFTYDPTVKRYAGRLRVDFMVAPLNQPFEVYLDF